MVVKVSGLKLRTKTFAFPGIEPGAIIEYKWKEVSLNSSANNHAAPVSTRHSCAVNHLSH